MIQTLIICIKNLRMKCIANDTHIPTNYTFLKATHTFWRCNSELFIKLVNN